MDGKTEKLIEATKLLMEEVSKKHPIVSIDDPNLYLAYHKCREAIEQLDQ